MSSGLAVLDEQQRARREQETGVVRCTLAGCAWTYEGSLLEGARQAKAHRRQVHASEEPKLPSGNRGRGGYHPPAQDVVDELVAAVRTDPGLAATEHGKRRGWNAGRAGRVLSEAARQNLVVKRWGVWWPADDVPEHRPPDARGRAALELLRERGELTTAEVAEVLGVSNLQMRSTLIRAREAGLVTSRGEPVRWRLTGTEPPSFAETTEGQAILALLRERGPLKQFDLQRALGVTAEAARDRARQLISEGLATSAGLGRGVTYTAISP